MSVFDSAMMSHNVLENDRYDWEKCDSEDVPAVADAATTPRVLSRLTPANLYGVRLLALIMRAHTRYKRAQEQELREWKQSVRGQKMCVVVNKPVPTAVYKLW